MVLTSKPPFTQWATAFADDQTLTAAMHDRLPFLRNTLGRSLLERKAELRRPPMQLLDNTQETLAQHFPA